MDSIIIPWNVGEGNIVINGDSSGNLLISSSLNEDVEREQILTFRSTTGNVTASLTVRQKGNSVYFTDADDKFVIDSEDKDVIVKQ